MIPLKEWAAQHGITPSTVRHKIAHGKLKAVKLGRDWFIEETTPNTDNRVKSGTYKNVTRGANTFQLLAERLRKDLGLNPDESTFTRTYAGSNMKKAGAFVWVCRLKDYPSMEVGSIYRASDLIKSKKPLTMNESDFRSIEIFREDKLKED